MVLRQLFKCYDCGFTTLKENTVRVKKDARSITFLNHFTLCKALIQEITLGLQSGTIYFGNVKVQDKANLKYEKCLMHKSDVLEKRVFKENSSFFNIFAYGMLSTKNDTTILEIYYDLSQIVRLAIINIHSIATRADNVIPVNVNALTL